MYSLLFPPCNSTCTSFSFSTFLCRTVSAPVALKRERPLKDKNAPMEANSLLTSPNKQQGQQQRLSGGGEGGKAVGTRRTGGTIPRRESDPSFQSRPSELHKKQSPMKKAPLKMFKTPPRKYHQGRVDEEEEGAPDLPFVHDLEAHPEFISPPKLKMNPIPPGGRTIKKISPIKAASAPQKSSTSISQANGTSNSAPVYRLGSQEPLVEEETSETDARLQELSPLVYPENAMRQALEGLRKGTEEWEEKCEALLVLRRLSAWHKPIIIPQLHTVLIAVEKEVHMYMYMYIQRYAYTSIVQYMYRIVYEHVHMYMYMYMLVLLWTIVQCNTFSHGHVYMFNGGK